MSIWKKVLGYTWASPVTTVCLIYAGTCHALGWYTWHGKVEDGLVWKVSPKAPGWLQSVWKNWCGHAIGNVVVMNTDPVKKAQILQHELVHVKQCMKLGIFQPIIYAISSLGIYLGCDNSHPYWSNPFEIDARRASGQMVDIEGTLKRIKEKNALQDQEAKMQKK